MNEFNPNCGKCGMLNSRGFCSLTACRYPSNAIVVEPKVIRGMMVNPQIENPQTNADRIRQMSDEELAEWIMRKPSIGYFAVCPPGTGDDCPTSPCEQCWLDWLKSPVEVDNG